MAGELELDAEGRESCKASFVELLCVDPRLGLCKELVVVLPEGRALRGDGFEASAIKIVVEFICELVEAVEVGLKKRDIESFAKHWFHWWTSGSSEPYACDYRTAIRMPPVRKSENVYCVSASSAI